MDSEYKSIFENTGTGTFIVEEDRTIARVNNEFIRLTGYARQELEGRMKWTALVAFSNDLQKMKTYHDLRRTTPGLAPRDYEFTLVTKKGDKKNILVRVDVIPGTKRSVASFHDITPIVTAQQSLRENEAKLRGILEAFEGYIYTCSRDFNVSYLNRQLQDIAGQTFSGKQCHEVVFNQKQRCTWCPIERVFQGRTIRQEFQCVQSGKWFYAISSPIFDANNKVIKQQTVLIDIHDRKQAELDSKSKEALLERENIKLRKAIKDHYKFCDIIGKTPVMQKIYELILKAAKTDATVIIYGESGTGKELVAKAIHEMSDRSGNHFVPVHCSAIPQNLLESEFFGVRKGAFTGANQDRDGFFAYAEKGTLFLDELGEIDLNIQVKLLRVIEGGGYTPVGGRHPKKNDVRIIAATNRDLHEQVKQGGMREDFYYRIHILPIYLPPLRDRKEDIPLLVDHFLNKYQTTTKHRPLTGQMLDALQRHDWPGNVRELENTIQRFINLDNIDILNDATIKNTMDINDMPPPDSSAGLPLQPALNQFEKTYITDVLNQNGWNRKNTAQALSISRKSLYLKMKHLGIQQLDIQHLGKN